MRSKSFLKVYLSEILYVGIVLLEINRGLGLSIRVVVNAMVSPEICRVYPRNVHHAPVAGTSYTVEPTVSRTCV
jgi:hypothetical protein